MYLSLAQNLIQHNTLFYTLHAILKSLQKVHIILICANIFPSDLKKYLYLVLLERNPDMITITGKATLTYNQPPRILEAASIVGQKEGDGPLSHLFDCIEPDPKFGKNTWEEAESELQLRTARKVLEKSGMTEEQIRYLFAGDLLAQGIATSYGIMELQIPLFYQKIKH